MYDNTWYWLNLDYWAFKVKVAVLEWKDGKLDGYIRTKFTPNWICRDYNYEDKEEFFSLLLNRLSKRCDKKDTPTIIEFVDMARKILDLSVSEAQELLGDNLWIRDKKIEPTKIRDFDFSEVM